MNMNKVFIAGNLVRDVELRDVGSTSVAKMTVASSESYKSRDGEKVDTTVYVDVEVWGKTAENCGRFLGKGSSVLVEGSLKLDTWETADGGKRSKLKVKGFNVQFLSKPKEQRSEGGGQGNVQNNGNAGVDDDNTPF